jgi:hypothetical protein
MSTDEKTGIQALERQLSTLTSTDRSEFGKLIR